MFSGALIATFIPPAEALSSLELNGLAEEQRGNKV